MVKTCTKCYFGAWEIHGFDLEAYRIICRHKNCNFVYADNESAKTCKYFEMNAEAAKEARNG